MVTGAGAVTSQGAVLFVHDYLKNMFVALQGATGINNNLSRPQLDVTNLLSQMKEYKPGLADPGELTTTLQVMYGTRSQEILLRDMETITQTPEREFRARIPDDGMGQGPVWRFVRGYITEFPMSSGAPGEVITADIKIQCSGPLYTETPGSKRDAIRFSALDIYAPVVSKGKINRKLELSFLKDETWAGTVGDEIDDITFTGVPEGLTAKVVQKSPTTAEIVFDGAAKLYGKGLSDTIGIDFGPDSVTSGNIEDIAGRSTLMLINWVDWSVK